MSKIWLITKREYLTRVRNRTFLLSTFLLPLMIVLFIAGSIFLSLQGKTRHRIAVIDANGYFREYLKSDSSISFDFSAGLDTLNYAQKGCTAVLIIPFLKEDQKTVYRLKYKKQLVLAGVTELAGRFTHAITHHLLVDRTSISREKLDRKSVV